MAKQFLKLKSLAYISRISVAFDPFDATSRGARNFLMKVQAGRQLRASNPKCEINEVIKEDMSPAVVEIEYADGSKDVLEAANARWQDLIENMNRKRSKLELDDLVAKAEKFEKEKR